MSANPAETVPHGFRRSVESGLIVPEAISRTREVWTRDDWRLLERAVNMLRGHRIQLLMKCGHPACQAAPMERIRSKDGGFVLRCGHAERVFQKAF